MKLRSDNTNFFIKKILQYLIKKTILSGSKRKDVYKILKISFDFWFDDLIQKLKYMMNKGKRDYITLKDLSNSILMSPVKFISDIDLFKYQSLIFKNKKNINVCKTNSIIYKFSQSWLVVNSFTNFTKRNINPNKINFTIKSKYDNLNTKQQLLIYYFHLHFKNNDKSGENWLLYLVMKDSMISVIGGHILYILLKSMQKGAFLKHDILKILKYIRALISNKFFKLDDYKFEIFLILMISLFKNYNNERTFENLKVKYYIANLLIFLKIKLKDNTLNFSRNLFRLVCLFGKSKILTHDLFACLLCLDKNCIELYSISFVKIFANQKKTSTNNKLFKKNLIERDIMNKFIYSCIFFFFEIL